MFWRQIQVIVCVCWTWESLGHIQTLRDSGTYEWGSEVFVFCLFPEHETAQDKRRGTGEPYSKRNHLNRRDMKSSLCVTGCVCLFRRVIPHILIMWAVDVYSVWMNGRGLEPFMLETLNTSWCKKSSTATLSSDSSQSSWCFQKVQWNIKPLSPLSDSVRPGGRTLKFDETHGWESLHL